jgi:uncharacterized protein YbjQ (UPF0145 family)
LELPPWELEEQKKWERQFHGKIQNRSDDADQSQQEEDDGPPLTLVTTDNITARRITYLGLVQGSVVLSKKLIGHVLAGTEENMGGEIEAYTRLMIDSRKIAVERMVSEARGMNANGVVAVRYHTDKILEGAISIVAYGTAVTFI